MNKIVSFIEEKKIQLKLEYLIMFFFPISVYYADRIMKKYMIPLLILMAVVNIYKKGLKISFYEKYMIGFIAVVVMSIIFENYVNEKNLYDRLKYVLRWITLPFILGQLELEKNHYKAAVLGYFCSFIIILKKSFKVIENPRLLKLFPTITENGIMLGIIVVFSYCILFNRKVEKKVRILVLPFLLLGGYFLTLTQARGMYVAMLATLTISFIVKIFNSPKRKKYIIIYSTLIALFLGALVVTPENNVYKERVMSILKGDEPRSVVYKEAFKLFKDNPITGIGYGNFKEAEKTIKNDYFYWGQYHHQHNMGLKMLSDTGIFGFLVYFSMMGALVINILKKREELINKIALGVISIYLVYENFETIVIYTRPNVYIWFLVGIAINSYYKKYEKNQKILKNL